MTAKIKFLNKTILTGAIFYLSFSIAYSGNSSLCRNLISGESSPERITTIKAHVKDKKVISFYIDDDISNNHCNFAFSRNNQLQKLIIIRPTLIISSFLKIPYLIYPGDQINLNIDKEGFPVLSILDNEIRNNELRFFVDYFKNYKTLKQFGLVANKNSFMVYSNTFSEKRTIEEAKKDSSKRFNFLRQFTKSFKVSKDFDQYVYIFFKNLYFTDVLVPLKAVGATIDRMPSQYFRYVDSLIFQFNCDSCLNNEGYRRTCLELGDYVARKFRHDGNQFYLNYDTVSLWFRHLTRRYVLYSLLKKNMPTSPVNYDSRLVSFLNEINDRFDDYLIKDRDSLNELKAKTEIDKDFISADGNRIAWRDLIKKYKGNTIYLDFWASWCIPCRKMLPVSKKLMHDLKNEKIMFLYISVDNAQLKWTKAMQQEHLNNSTSYILGDQKKSAVKKLFAIDAIPRYMIINRDGVIVDGDAPRPDSLLTKEILIKINSR